MPVTGHGLDLGLASATLSNLDGQGDYVKVVALTSANKVIGATGVLSVAFDRPQHVVDKSNVSAFKLRTFLYDNDAQINIQETGVVHKLAFVMLGRLHEDILEDEDGHDVGSTVGTTNEEIRFTIQLDTGINVVNGGYITVKKGENNTYLEIQSAK